jgi:hypothetical protein
MADPDPLEESFRVIDRRGRPTEPVPAPHQKSLDPSSLLQQDPVQSPEPSPSAAPETPAALELTALFLMLASSALVHLGEAPDPMTRKVQRDLAQAQYTIDLLILLREKTEGNRTPEETQLLDEIIRDLQMRFVRAVGPG